MAGTGLEFDQLNAKHNPRISKILLAWRLAQSSQDSADAVHKCSALVALPSQQLEAMS